MESRGPAASSTWPCIGVPDAGVRNVARGGRMFQILRHWSFLSLQSSMSLLDYSTVPEPDCYANQATSLTPCGLCKKPATKLDTATGQVMFVACASATAGAGGRRRHGWLPLVEQQGSSSSRRAECRREGNVAVRRSDGWAQQGRMGIRGTPRAESCLSEPQNKASAPATGLRRVERVLCGWPPVIQRRRCLKPCRALRCHEAPSAGGRCLVASQQMKSRLFLRWVPLPAFHRRRKRRRFIRRRKRRDVISCPMAPQPQRIQGQGCSRHI